MLICIAVPMTTNGCCLMQEVKIPFLRAFKTYIEGVGEEIIIK